jgi:hypothetical protein
LIFVETEGRIEFGCRTAQDAQRSGIARRAVRVDSTALPQVVQATGAGSN